MRGGPLSVAADTAANDRDRSVSLNELGDVLIAQGDLGGARGRYQEGLDIFKRLAAADPSSAALQRDVGASLNKLGNVLVAQGDLVKARERYQESSDILTRLAAADASSAALQRDVSVSLNKLGDVLVAQGDLGGARGRYQENLEIRKHLSAADASSATLHARRERELGQARRRAGRPERPRRGARALSRELWRSANAWPRPPPVRQRCSAISS